MAASNVAGASMAYSEDDSPDRGEAFEKASSPHCRRMLSALWKVKLCVRSRNPGLPSQASDQP